MKSKYIKMFDNYGVRMVLEKHVCDGRAMYIVKGFFQSGLRIYRTASPYLYERVDGSTWFSERAEARWACRMCLLLLGEREHVAGFE